MFGFKRFQVFIFLLLIVSLACGLPNITIPDSNSISTAAAETILAGLTQNTALASQEPTFTPTFTSIPETPSITLTLTQTLTPTATYTSTSAITLITVSVATNCRNGPGIVYGRVGALLVNQTAE